jgi:hypothetical protein
MRRMMSPLAIRFRRRIRGISYTEMCDPRSKILAETDVGLLPGAFDMEADIAMLWLQQKSVLAQESDQDQRRPIQLSDSAALAAAALVDYLDQFVWPSDKPFPADLEFDERKMQVTGTTVDGVLTAVPIGKYYNDLAAGVAAYGIPLFSRPVRDRIVELVSQLDGAPTPDSTGEMGEKLFRSQGAWWFYMYRIGVLTWALLINPIGLDLEQYPQRRGIEFMAWRWRSSDYGFVHHAFLQFMRDAAEAGVKGAELRKFEREWVDEFTRGDRTFMIEGDRKPKSMDNFSVAGKPGTPDQFRSLWTLVKTGKAEPQKLRRRGAGQ